MWGFAHVYSSTSISSKLTRLRHLLGQLRNALLAYTRLSVAFVHGCWVPLRRKSVQRRRHVYVAAAVRPDSSLTLSRAQAKMSWRERIVKRSNSRTHDTNCLRKHFCKDLNA